MSTDTSDMQPVSFDKVFEDELKQIESCRQYSRGVRDIPPNGTLTGLAFSGGGIRSATFNLGILQALAKKRLLSKFDYLSTVSGGGYIGSWLAAFTRRFPQSAREFAPIENALGDKTYEVGKPAEEPAIHWLRNYADYLTPQMGLISGDTGAMVGTWLRNVILNLIVIVIFLMGAILLPYFLVLSTRLFVFRSAVAAFFVGVLLLVFATLVMGKSMVDFSSWEENRRKNWFRRNRVELGVILPYFACAWLINSAMWAWPDISYTKLWWWWIGAAIFYGVTWWMIDFVSEKETAAKAGIGRWSWVVISALGSGAVGGALLYWYARGLSYIPRDNDSNTWSVIIFGTAALMLLMQFVAVLQLGLLGSDCLDLVREWWARAGGQLLLTIALWLTIFAIVVFGPLGVRLLVTKHSSSALGAMILWLISNLTGILATKSDKTVGEIKSTPAILKAVSGSKSSAWWNSPRVLDFIARIAPYVFAVGLLVLLSNAVHILYGLLLAGPEARAVTQCLWFTKRFWDIATPTADIYRQYWLIQSSGFVPCIFLVAAGLIGVAGVLSWRIDINDFSMHHFYRNRLVRCYLGASRIREREPQPFTGFDPHDDIPLEELRDGYPGPYPILNSSLNVSSGGELGFQTRRAKSFIFTPQYCGYDLSAKVAGIAEAERDDSYLPTSAGRKKTGSDRGITLGTAMAISGAAASPNMGHYTTTAAAFFMTLFDVRLGWWMGNPRYPDKWQSPGPRPALGYLLKELVAQSDEASNYVYLSDGGHFENLAMYELVKRRCQFIMVCDSGADRGYTCGDLMGAIEKCRTDFGVDIKITVSEIKPEKDQCLSLKNYAIGDIYYGPNDRGVLIYIKSSLPVDNPQAPLETRLAAGVRSYADAHPDFPHQSTADQWFDEIQFESYRALGEYVGTAAAEAIRSLPPDRVPAVLKAW